MAGSYNHCVHHSYDGEEPLPIEREGQFDYGGDDGIWVPLVENLGDAGEALEEMYGMIWWLANRVSPGADRAELLAVIEDARQNYSPGVELGTGQSARW